MGAATVTPTTRVKPSAPSLRRCIIANDCTRLWPIGRPPSSKKIYHAAGLLRSSPAAWSAQLVSPRAHPWHLTQPVPNFRVSPQGCTPFPENREINRETKRSRCAAHNGLSQMLHHLHARGAKRTRGGTAAHCRTIHIKNQALRPQGVPEKP